MDLFEEYLLRIENPPNRARVSEVLSWVSEKFPDLQTKIAWNQPMFTHHGTFIIGFSTAKHHLAIAPERAGILRFSEEVVKAGYDHTKELIRIKWSAPIDYALLERIIRFNMAEKADCSNFWRK